MIVLANVGTTLGAADRPLIILSIDLHEIFVGSLGEEDPTLIAVDVVRLTRLHEVDGLVLVVGLVATVLPHDLQFVFGDLFPVMFAHSSTAQMMKLITSPETKPT